MILPDEATHLARLFNFLKLGEVLARDCAQMQAKHIYQENPRDSKFLRAQARQETMHAGIFHSAALWLAPKSRRHRQQEEVFEQYRAQVRHALDENRFSESLFAVQVLLEGIGESVLTRLDLGISRRGMGLKTVRRTILNQEAAHHHFGHLRLTQAISNDGLSLQESNLNYQPYLVLAQKMLVQMGAVFEGLDENKADYIQDISDELPSFVDHSLLQQAQP